MFDNPYASITESQKAFVSGRGADLDGRGWAVDYRQNLFAPLHDDTAQEFEDAGELTPAGAGRIAAPHSSTALAINMFDVWRDRELGPLGEAMQVDITHLVGYERPHDLGFQRPAQPDIEFTGTEGRPVAIEVKLREPYGNVKNEFADRYFETPGLWDGLPNLRDLAESIDRNEATFTTLHAAQLVKHAIGLRRSYGDAFVLGYLWHYIPSDTGDNHIRELEEFTAIAASDIRFVSWTVEQVLGGLDTDRCDPDWYVYMAGRYGAGSVK
jgi:hypothetical protein